MLNESKVVKYQVLVMMNSTCAVSAKLKNFKDDYSTEKC